MKKQKNLFPPKKQFGILDPTLKKQQKTDSGIKLIDIIKKINLEKINRFEGDQVPAPLVPTLMPQPAPVLARAIKFFLKLLITKNLFIERPGFLEGENQFVSLISPGPKQFTRRLQVLKSPTIYKPSRPVFLKSPSWFY